MRDVSKKIDKIAEDIFEIKSDLAEMKVDLRHHIKRSDQHETLLMHLSKVKERMYGIVAFIGFVTTVFALIAAFAKVLN